MIRACVRCGQEHHIAGRGLCQSCYHCMRRSGRLERYPCIGQIVGAQPPDWRAIAEDRKREIDRLRARIQELEHGTT
jgi:hypothetical protein